MGKEWDRLGAGIEPFADSDYGADDGNTFGQTGGQHVRYGKSAKPMQEWHEGWATEALRVLKPGGHLLAFGGTRTYHRLACAVEDAGFEIRDTICWLYGSGFPKSLDVSKAIDKAAGAEGSYGEPKLAAHAGWIERGAMRGEEGHEGYQRPWMKDGEAVDKNARKYEPATPEAAQWEGWGTALKPAHEPIVVARKPLVGTVAANVLEHGTGALNIDGCRIGLVDGVDDSQIRIMNRSEKEHDGWGMNTTGADEPQVVRPEGRWPANVVLSHLPECEQVGTRRVKTGTAVKRHGVTSEGVTGWGKAPPGTPDVTHADPDGTEQVAAWRCAENCPVAALDEQSGELQSHSGKALGSTAGAQAIYGTEMGKTYDDLPGDTGGASRFFLTVQSDTLCVLCGIPCVESAGNPSPPNEVPSGTAPSDAQDEPPPRRGGSKASSDTPASNAGASSRTTPPTDTAITSTVPPSADTPLAEWIVQLARSAANLCGSCGTAIAQSIVLTLRDQIPESEAGPPSTLALKRQILSRSLALIAEGSRSTGTIPTMATLNALCGSVAVATIERTPESVMASGSGQSASNFPSRSLYCAKSSRAERNAGLDGFEERETRGNYGDGIQDARPHTPEGYEYRAVTKNVHPTVKPIDLMRWLVRLVCPVDGTVLDLFVGSGTTGIAAVLEGFDFIGIEREAEYVEIAKARIAWWEQHQGRGADEVLAESRRSEAIREQHEAVGQMGLEL